MKLEEMYKSEKPVITFEVFPPKKDDFSELLLHLSVLKKYNPALVSVTYGAGGSSREKSFDIVKSVKKELGITPMPHFTCICSSKDFIVDYLNKIQAEEIENILALRGDEPKEIDVCYRDFRYANELTEFIKQRTSLSVAVAGYPEGHVDSASIEDDIDNLKRKVSSGASVIYTQLFFDNRYFLDFMERLDKADIQVPVIPGILPVSSYAQLKRMTEMCGSKVPLETDKFFSKYADDEKSIFSAGVDFASRQCEELLAAGVKGFHFYTLNKSDQVSNILENIIIQ